MERKFLHKLSIILILLFALMGCRQQAKPEEKSTIAVEVITVERKGIEEVITLRGQLKPSEEIMVFAKVPGLKVTKLSVEVGDMVEEGTFLFELDKTLVRKQVEQAKMNYDLAKENYNQQKQLMEKGNELQEEATVFKNIGKIPSKYESLIKDNPNNSKPGLEAALVASSTQLEQARMGYVNTLEQLGELEYYAPITGVVSQLNIQENQLFLNNIPAVVVSNTDELKVALSVSAPLFSELKKDQKVKVRNEQQAFQGKVSLINPITDPRSNLHNVEVLVRNNGKYLNSGSFVFVDIQRSKKEDVIVIPKNSLVFEGNEEYVYIEKEGKAHRQKVELGINTGNEVEIIDGLKKGDRVIVKGQHFIEDLTPVSVRRGKNEDN